MNQAIAAPVIEQPDEPQKLKKNFCFATIPFIFVALIGLYQTVRQLFNIDWGNINNPDKKLFILAQFIILLSFLFILVGAILITALLFAKQNKAFLSIPLYMFSASYLLLIVGDIIGCLHIPFFSDFIKSYIPDFICCFLISLSFLAVAIYTSIVTVRKKPAPKVLWLIPAIIFDLFVFIITIFYTVLTIYNVIYFWSWEILFALLKIFPDRIIGIPFIIAITHFLIWLTFPYKKDKAKKPVQLVTAAPVAPSAMPVALPPMMSEVKPAEESAKKEEPEKSTVKPAEAVKPAVKPAPKPPVQPVQRLPVKPVQMPPVQPAHSNDAERQRTNMQLLKEYKELLDNGVITQEDYDKKKSELLGL